MQRAKRKPVAQIYVNDTAAATLCQTPIAGQVECWIGEKLPARKAGGLYKINRNKVLGFRRGLSVPRISGQRGHVSFQTDPLPKRRSDHIHATSNARRFKNRKDIGLVPPSNAMESRSQIGCAVPPHGRLAEFGPNIVPAGGVR